MTESSATSWTEWMSPVEFNKQQELEGEPTIEISSFLQEGKQWMNNPRIEAMYVFLDTPQLKMFSQSVHNYLITTVRQHTFSQLKSAKQNLPLYLFEPIKEMVWLTQRDDVRKRNDWFNFSNYKQKDITETEHFATLSPTTSSENQTKSILKSAQIMLNNQPRIQPKDAEYFNKIQPFWYFKTKIPNGVHLFSFSLYPKQFQPSGSCNMAQVKKVDLNVDIVQPIEEGVGYNMSVYTIGYNILRIQNGTGGLVFSA